VEEEGFGGSEMSTDLCRFEKSQNAYILFYQKESSLKGEEEKEMKQGLGE
jgi:hypothetical protein